MEPNWGSLGAYLFRETPSCWVSLEFPVKKHVLFGKAVFVANKQFVRVWPIHPGRNKKDSFNKRQTHLDQSCNSISIARNER